MSDKSSTSTQIQKKRKEKRKQNPTHSSTLFGGVPNLSFFPFEIYIRGIANVVVPTEICEVSRDTRLVLPPPSSTRDHASYVTVDVDQIQMVRETER